MNPAIFYAWAVPAVISEAPLDHTWVTVYDNRINSYGDIQSVINAGQFYWYCWGSFHPHGNTPVNRTGFLGSQNGDLGYAQCLVVANADSSNSPAARGTIFTYGVDGVCHQLANQVLYATRGNGVNPLTVSQAQGYHVSTFLYGTYGLQHSAWQNKQNTCSGSKVLGATGVLFMTTIPDEFEQHVKDILGTEQVDLANKLISLKNEIHTQRADVRLLQLGQTPNAENINQQNQQKIDEAARLLGDELFEKVFGFPPKQKINLVDPEIMSRINKE
jgi:hypothetical protein